MTFLFNESLNIVRKTQYVCRKKIATKKNWGSYNQFSCYKTMVL